LLRRAPLVIEPDHRPTGQAQIRDDKTHSREQLAGMVLDLGDDPSRLRPARPYCTSQLGSRRNSQLSGRFALVGPD
jgi:hypothetical protein